MIELDGPVRPYAWGSRSFLAGLRGEPVPSPQPEAELWLGAHPDAPSLAAGRPLGELIDADPSAVLGEAVLSRYGARLPYLLKLLAADTALSIQVHPDAQQAREGFAARPGYRDPYPKPELLVAVTPFEALCGFREPAAITAELAALDVPALAPVIDALAHTDAAVALNQALALLLNWPEPRRADLVGAVTAAGHPLAVRLAQQYPGDIGVVVALLLNHITLAPGEAVFMPAGNVHAYLGGAGVEIMGASDNVLRAGLTVKSIDPPELMRLVRYEVLHDPRFPATPLGPGLTAWRPPVAEFALVRAVASGAAPVTLPGGGPRIVVGLRGEAGLRAGDVVTTLRPGRAVFLGATEPEVEVTVAGDGADAEVYQASPGA